MEEKFENCNIIKNIISREFNYAGDIQGCMYFKFLDLEEKKARKQLKNNIKQMIEICNNALNELKEVE